MGKQKHNEDLEHVIIEIKGLIEETKKIDEKRAKLLDQRYNLEKKYIKSNAETNSAMNDELITENKEFMETCSATKRDMTAFTGGEGVIKVIKRSNEIMGKFYENAADAF